MCGIVGYVGDKKVTDVLMQGLKSLEYRGYDSAGITVRSNEKCEIIKSVGKIVNLEEKVKNLSGEYTMGIGHTRWATHGSVTEVNSHPHKIGNVTLVHNGIIENYRELKCELMKLGYEFKTETDTEVICALIDSYKGEKLDALVYAQMKLIGSYALLVMFDDDPENMYAVRKDSPLIVGVGESENFVASDISAILPYTKKYIEIEPGEVVKISKEKTLVYNEQGVVSKEVKVATWNIEDAQKQGYPHFMLKEMEEEKELTDKLINKFIDEEDYSVDLPDLSRYRRIDIVACGSAYFAGNIGKYLIDKYVMDGSVQVDVDVASEYRYKNHYFNEDSLLVVVSQSGETADTLACLRMAKERDVDTLAIVNVPSSSIAKEAKFVVPMLAGPEIAVATTKGYYSQVLELSLIAQKLGSVKGTISEEEKKKLILELRKVREKLESVFDIDYASIADKMYDKDHIYFIGRGLDYLAGMEASLKLKEISYIHSDVYQAGELKHGPIALIENGTPVIALITDADLKDKALSNAIEAKARGAKLTLLTTSDIEVDEELFEDIIRVPRTSEFYQTLINVVPFQLLAYEVAKAKGCDIDKPKNLAKSVTVE